MLPPIVYLGCGPHLLRAEHIDRLRPPRIALLQQRLRELRMRGRVREELRLEAEARAPLEADTFLADMAYADAFGHPLIDCQEGALRDDFDFGAMILFRSAAFREALSSLPRDLKYGALYGVRLALGGHIVHINEPLYTATETDRRKSGEKLFALWTT